MTFSVKTSDSGVVDSVIKAATLSAVQFAPEMGRLGQQLLEEISGQFFGARDPYNQPWAPLKAITVEIKKRKGSPNADKTLQDTGRLRDSFRAEVLPSGNLSIYTDRRFRDGTSAEIHQFGGTHPRSQSFIPSRELLPFRDQLPTEWLSWVEVFTSIGVDRVF